ncbi:MAG: cyclic pyranopterin monophosphate synthase MoaC [Blastocatellia bacterium]|nr:cyclic pyranopterin monophosphate synthase MoaC [Blastocatellia bacterium]
MGFSHLDEAGRIKMVDVSAKEVTDRTAVASGRVRMAPATITAIREHRTPKGDPLEAARLAGIMAAKQTDRLIPLCHSLPLSHVDVTISLEDDAAVISATARTAARTGVEMEALTAVSVAALTLYDMCKAVDKHMVITDIVLKAKTGGKSQN